MLPLSRRLPSISKGISCATSSKRLYAYAASPLNEPLADTQTGAGEGVDLTPQSVQVTTLENGLRVASLETHSPKSRIGLFINAASRHETPSTLGITHALRSAAFLGNVDYSGFRITRELEHYGATLEATCNRENLVYSADCLRSNIGLVVDNLANIVKKPTFYGWEVDQVTDRLKLDLAIKDAQPPINVVEELHRVAFRKTLGNSLYCLPHRTGKFSSELLKEYTQECYVGQRMTLVGVGVDHSQLVNWAKSTLSFLPKGEPATKEAAKYHGGEVVHFSSGPLVHAVLATEGASLGSKDLLTLSVYQKILGATPYIKWGSNSISNRLLMTATESTSGAVAASAFNASYSDSGLFGFYVVAEPSDVSKVMKSVIGQFSKASKGEISDQEVTRAKNQMKAHILMNGESQETLFEDIGSQISTKGSYTAPQEVAAAVDSVTKADILTVAKRVFSGKPSLSAIGDVSMMPGLDELM
ncbi:cytochrome b-c1 complex subunit 2, mitochondrial [Pocillopora verrucosa]|uniref:cytochrome b-c1 complex subunit 2, mitochondrial n=1 Tax=Pocillopora verrucosa TaxID=203993 RepID=UPI0027972334|nr:cytochrome b-c1 complex subunit 2, mitochondrial-like [Pocillopora verrucosa]